MHTKPLEPAQMAEAAFAALEMGQRPLTFWQATKAALATVGITIVCTTIPILGAILVLTLGGPLWLALLVEAGIVTLELALFFWVVGRHRF